MALKRCIGRVYRAAFVLVAASLCTFFYPAANAADLGATITNQAAASYGPSEARVTIASQPASFVVEARRTQSTIEFLRYAPSSPEALALAANGSDFSPDEGGAFTSVGPVHLTSGEVLDLSQPVLLAVAPNYFAGEVIFVRVEDAGQNGNSSRIETVTISLSSQSGDSVQLRLYETGPDTGVFLGYIQSAPGAVIENDNMLTILRGEILTALYQDFFDATETSSVTAGVDPFGRLFDSLTGDLVDGAVVTIVDAATGAPADVFGVDGVSAYPSTLTTGGTVTDASGFVYDLGPGEFVFPIMLVGEYRLIVDPPAGYQAPSRVSAQDLENLPGGPFEIVPASYLGAFVLDGTRDVSFDVPLDPDTEIIITKLASTDVASIGDFLRYEIRIENNGSSAAPIIIRDMLPEGFRYQAGSAKVDGAALADPLIGAAGRELEFSTGVLTPGDAASLSYVVEVGPGSGTGEAVNSAFVTAPSGSPLSNVAQAGVFLREDLLRSTLTIAGRVAADACDLSEDWPRKISAGRGVENIRLYMENGAYTTTDKNGLFHFADIEAKRHVVQLDEITLPPGYEAVLCEENTRFAGTPASQFVDAQGGAVWRANFYLRRNEALDVTGQGPVSAEEAVAEALEYKQFDDRWLEGADAETAFAYPAVGHAPSARSIHVGVKHENFTRVTLLVNGAKVAPIKFSGREVNKARTVALSRWRGVPLVDGDNELLAIVSDEAGNEVDRIKRSVSFVTEAAQAELLPEASRLMADGRTPPVIAVRITDGAGRPVHGGRMLDVMIDAPYRALDKLLLEDALPITEPLAARVGAQVGRDGVALIELQPTLETGAARLTIALDNGQEQEIKTFIKPELRDWIVVGLAEGGMQYERETTPGAPSATELLRDGRVAVFAKGAVKGGWLVTAAVDTDKSRGENDGQVFEDIDPDARYSTFGDRSTQEFEAQSQLPFYLKVEKGGMQGTIGDFDTGLDETRLGKYSRRLTGAQVFYEGEQLRFRGFAANTDQRFIRDELAADGTSGPFRLSAAPLVRNGETIFIETRNRFRPDEVIAVTALTRYLDYDIDFATGEFILRLPVPAAPDENGFNVLVAEYETLGRGPRRLVGGGRGAFRAAGDRIEIGATGLYQEGAGGADEKASELAALDLRAEITDTTTLRLEYGVSRKRFDEADIETSDATLAEIKHVSGRVTGRAYYEDTQAGYGFGQQSSAVAGVRRYGGEARVKVHEFTSERSGAGGERAIESSAYREENLLTGARRFVAHLKLRHDGAYTSASAGLKRVVERTAEGVKRRSTLATIEARQRFEKLGLTLRASRDQPVGGDNESIQFPQRTTFGFEQTLFKTVRLDVSHEINEGDNQQSTNTIVGIVAEPWTGARLSAAADKISQDTGERLGATFGVDQQVRINERWSTSFGVSRRQELSGEGEISRTDDIVPDGPVSPLEEGGNFTSVFIGAGYRDEKTQASTRFEMKKSAEATRYVGVLGAARDVSEAFSFAGAARIEQSDVNGGPDQRRIDMRIGAALRPRDNGLIIFDRFDLKQHLVEGDLVSWKAVNNLGLNVALTDRWALSMNHGVKYAVLETGDASYTGFTQLLGVETRYDITRRIDLGMRAMAIYSHNSGTAEYSFGPSIGFNPADNIWLSAGYHFDGFSDDDFAFADYTRKGPFIRLRIKFDQGLAAGLLEELSPAG